MPSRKDKSTKGTSASATQNDPVTGMASLATSQTVPGQSHDTEGNFQAFVKSALQSIQGQMNELKEEIKANTDDVVRSLDFNSGQTNDLKDKIDLQNNTIIELRRELAQALSTVRLQATQIEDLESDKNYLETYMRKSNLIFEGCSETDNEDTTMIIGNILNNVMNLNVNCECEIDKTHRIGRSIAGRPRPIIVKFIRHSIRDYVLTSAKRLKDYREKIFINEDLPAAIKSRRAELRSIVQHAKSEGVSAKQSGDKITIAGQTYDYKTLDCLPAKFALEATRTKAIGDEVTGFYSKHSPLSNFYPCSFEIDNTTYNSVEQAYQASKAKCVGRDDVAGKIMTQTDGLTMMRRGNMIKISRDSPWLDQREKVMKTAVLAKFSQNECLRQKLDATGDRMLVETTRDPFWGAGVTINSPSLLNRSWNGQNKLGKILVEVRSHLRNH